MIDDERDLYEILRNLVFIFFDIGYLSYRVVVLCGKITIGIEVQGYEQTD